MLDRSTKPIINTCRSPMGLRPGILVSNDTSVSDQASQSPMVFQSGMSVSDESPIWHVSLRLVSDESFQSPMGLG